MSPLRWPLIWRILVAAIVTALALRMIPEVVGAAYGNLGSLSLVRGRVNTPEYFGKAKAFYMVSLAWTSQNRATRASVGLARVLNDLGQTDAATSLSDLVSTETDPLLTLELGEQLWRRGDAASAMTCWKRVPDLDLFYAVRGMSHESHGDVKTALADYHISWAISDRPHAIKATALLNFCTLLRRENDIPLAIAVCETSRQSINSGWADMLLGMTYFNQRDFAKAESYFREAQEIGPFIYRVDLWLGLAVARQGRLSEAIQIYERGLIVAPNDGWSNYELGKALLDAGMNAKARGYLERSIQLAGDSYSLPEARRMLDELR
jgi:hypothetical protein